MIYRLFQKNSLVPFALLPFLMVVFWGKSLFSPVSDIAPHNAPMPLCEVISYIFLGHSLLTSLMSLFLAFITLFSLNRMNTRHQFLKKQNILPGLIFLIFVSSYPVVQQMLDVWFFVVFFVFAIDRLFIATSKREVAAEVFNAVLLVSIGTLFFGKGIYFFPLLFWAMALLNISSFRSVLAAVIGMLVPYWLAFGVYFFMGEEARFFANLFENILSPVAFFDHSLFSKIFNGLLVLLIFLSVIITLKVLNTQKIITRKFLRVFIWVVVYGVLLAATPFFSMEIIPVIGVGASIIIANYFENFRSSFYRELVFFLFFVVTAISQYVN